MPRQVQHLEPRLILTKAPCQLVAGHSRHHQIRHHDVEHFLLLRERDGLDAVGGGEREMPRIAQHPVDEPADRLLVVHDEYSQRAPGRPFHDVTRSP